MAKRFSEQFKQETEVPSIFRLPKGFYHATSFSFVC
jgi:hypothetical protein